MNRSTTIKGKTQHNVSVGTVVPMSNLRQRALSKTRFTSSQSRKEDKQEARSPKSSTNYPQESQCAWQQKKRRRTYQCAEEARYSGKLPADNAAAAQLRTMIRRGGRHNGPNSGRPHRAIAPRSGKTHPTCNKLNTIGEDGRSMGEGGQYK